MVLEKTEAPVEEYGGGEGKHDCVRSTDLTRQLQHSTSCAVSPAGRQKFAKMAHFRVHLRH